MAPLYWLDREAYDALEPLVEEIDDLFGEMGVDDPRYGILADSLSENEEGDYIPEFALFVCGCEKCGDDDTHLGLGKLIENGDLDEIVEEARTILMRHPVSFELDRRIFYGLKTTLKGREYN